MRASIRDFNSVSSCLAEPTKISRLCQLVDTWFSKHDRSTAALIYIIESLNLALFYKDVSESEVTVSFLAGQKKGQVPRCRGGTCVVEWIIKWWSV